jgi:amino acid adenylation domain-containing protein
MDIYSIDDFFSYLEERRLMLIFREGQLVLQANKSLLNKEEQLAIKNDIFISQFIRENKRALINRLETPEKVVAMYRLSPLQSGLLYHSILNNESVAYTEQMACEFPAGVDIELFRACWKRLIHRHSILRSKFVYKQTALPLQCVMERVDVPLTEIDFSMLSKEVQSVRLESFRQQDIEKGFALDQAPLMRLTLIRLGQNRYSLVWTYHHILLDGWSVSIVTRELLQSYQNLDASKEGNVEKLDNYEDYIKHIASIDRVRAEQFWRGYLSGLSQGALISILEQRNGLKAGEHFGNVSVSFDASMSKGVNAFIKKHHLTSNTLMQGVWSLVLSTFTGEDNILFGAVVSGRPEQLEDAENRVGLYINTLPLRTTIDRARDVVEWLQELQERHVEARKHQYVSLTDIRSFSDIKGDLFNTILAFENYPVSEQVSAQKHLRIENILTTERSNYALTVVASFREKLNVNFVYDESKLSKHQLSQISDHFQFILKQIVQGVGQSLGELDLTCHAAHALVRETLLNQQISYPSTITVLDVFRSQVAKRPKSCAVSCGEINLSYEELDKRSSQLANLLINNINNRPAPIGLCVERSVDLIVGVLGILKSGCAYLPLDPDYPPSRLQFMLENADVTLVITQEKFRHLISVDFCTLAIDGSEEMTMTKSSNKDPMTPLSPDDLAYIIYTSGTTGQPKGSLITHRNIVRLFFSDKALFDFHDHDVWTMLHSICFDFSVWELFGALLHGGRLVLVTKPIVQDSIALADLLVREQVTVLNQTPAAFYVLQEIILSTPSGLLNKLRYVIFGGEALAPQKLLDWHQRFSNCALINMYGITETTVHVTFMRLAEEDLRSNVSNIGMPIPTLSCFVLDRFGKPVPQGVSGELYVGGLGVSSGYVNSPSLTATKFLDGSFIDPQAGNVYKTGDLVRWLENGCLEYMGRIDDQVKIRGYRIELSEVELAIRKAPGVRQCVVGVRSDATGSKTLIAFITKSHGAAEVDAVKDFLRTKLPSHMMPTRVVAVPEIPLTSNGKVNKKALLERLDTSDENVHDDHSNTPLESSLIELWKSVLHIDQVGLHDSFYELGGHSLNAVQLVFKIKQQLSLDITLAELITRQTIHSIANYLSVSTTAKTSPRVEQNPTSEVYPLSPSQLKLWVHEQLHPGQTAYTISSSFRMIGTVRTDFLIRSIKQVYNCHDILRSNIIVKDGEPLQIVRNGRDPDISLIDYSTSADAHQKTRTLSTTLRYQQFDLSTDNLLRVTIVKQSSLELIFLLNVHHIVFDGWSLELFFNELSKAYSRMIEGSTDSIMPLPNQYGKYSSELRSISPATHTNTIRFWTQYVKRLAPVELPLSEKNESQTQFDGDTISVEISSDIESLIKLIATSNRATVFTVLLASVKSFFYRQTGQADLGIITPTAGRTHVETEQLIGFFANTIPIISKIKKGATFCDVITEEQRAFIEVLEMSSLPFDWIMEQVEKSTDYTKTAGVLNVMVALQNISSIGIVSNRLKDVIVEPYVIENKQSRFDLTFNFIESPSGNLSLNIDYSSSTFSSVAIELLASRYQAWLETILSQPTTPIDDLDYMTWAERNFIEKKLNQTSKEYPTYASTVQAFEYVANRNPHRIAVIFETVKYTYETVNRASDRLASSLFQMGIRTGDNICVNMDSSVNLIVSMMAIWKLGAVYVPLNKELPRKRKLHIAQETAATMIITDVHFEPTATTAHIFFWNDSIYSTITDDQKIAPIVEWQEVAYIIFTSGSSGEPKGVPIKHKSLVDRILYHIDYLEIDERIKFLQFCSIGFDASLAEILMPLLSGGTVVIPTYEEKKSIPLLIQLIDQQKVSAALFSPSFLAELDGAPLETVEIIISTGEAASVKQALHYSQVKRFYNGYGPTETCFGATFFKMGEPAVKSNPELVKKSLPLGTPFANTQIYILDDQYRLVGRGMWGQIAIGGIGLSPGYLNDPVRTREKFIPNPFTSTGNERIYLTGDRGRWSIHNILEYAGRTDDQVQLFGVRIEPGEIEAAIKKINGVQNVAIIIDAEKSKSISAFITTSGGSLLNSGMIHQILRQELPIHMIPGRIEFLEKFPLTANGKIDKRKLSSYHSSELPKQTARLTKQERALADLWTDVLGRPVEDANLHFLEVGGSSLKAIKLISSIFQHRQQKITLADVYNYPTLRTMSQHLVHVSIGAGTLHDEFEDQQYSPVSPVQERLWIIQQYNDAQSIFNIYAITRWDGSLDFSILQRAIHEVIRLHSILRSRIITVHGQPYLQEMELQSTDHVSIVKMVTGASDVAAALSEEIQKPFDLEGDTLLRCLVIKTNADQYFIAIVTHHIIADGWSMNLIIGKAAEFYNAEICGKKASTYHIPSFQYKDHAISQRLKLMDGEYKKHQQYWLETLKEPRARFDFQMDFKRPEIRSFRGNKTEYKLPVDLADHVSDAHTRWNISEFTVYLAGVYLLVYQLEGVKDIVLGTDTLGRDTVDLEYQPGVFLNTVPLRLQIKGSWTFHDLLHSVHHMLESAIVHDAYPFDHLMDALHEKKDLSRSPLFDIFVLNQKMDSQTANYTIPGVRLEPVSFTTDYAKFEVSFIFTETAGHSGLSIEYNRDLYTQDRIDLIAKTYIELLEEFVRNPEKIMRQSNQFSAAHRNKEEEEFLKLMNSDK